MIKKLEKLIQDAKNVNDDHDNSIEFESMAYTVKLRRSFDSAFRPYMEISLDGIQYDRIMIDDKNRESVVKIWESLRTLRFREKSARVNVLRENVCDFMKSL